MRLLLRSAVFLALAAPLPAAAKPYNVVAVTMPKPMDDPAFEAFRKQVAEAAQKKDKAALGKLTVEKDFFWVQEAGDTADKAKPGIEHLAKALALDDKDDAEGWETLEEHATRLTAAPSLDYKGSFCAPGEPVFNHKELQDAIDATRSDISDWAYMLRDGVEMRTHPKDDAAVAEKLGLHFVRVLDEDAADDWVKIAAPSGKTGFVPEDALSPLGNDEICYAKDAAGAWKISGYVGGGEPN